MLWTYQRIGRHVSDFTLRNQDPRSNLVVAAFPTARSVLRDTEIRTYPDIKVNSLKVTDVNCTVFENKRWLSCKGD